jgi:hypothetical protein
MEMRKGILSWGSEAFIARGAEGVGHDAVGSSEPTSATWFGRTRVARRVAPSLCAEQRSVVDEWGPRSV